MLEYLLNSYDFLIGLPLYSRFVVIIFLSVFSPGLFIPIMASMYLSGLMFNLYMGLAVASFGYLVSIFFYYHIGKYFTDTQAVANLLTSKIGKQMYKLESMSFLYITIFSFFLPFLVLSIGLGIFKKNIMYIFAIYFGALPSIVAFVIAGNIGKSFFEVEKNNFLFYSMISIVGFVLVQKLFKVYLKSKGLLK